MLILGEATAVASQIPTDPPLLQICSETRVRQINVANMLTNRIVDAESRNVPQVDVRRTRTG